MGNGVALDCHQRCQPQGVRHRVKVQWELCGLGRPHGHGLTGLMEVMPLSWKSGMAGDGERGEGRGIDQQTQLP